MKPYRFLPRSVWDYRRFLWCILAVGLAVGSAGCDSAKKHYQKGNRYLEQGRYDQAVTELQQALEICRDKDDEPCGLYQDQLTYAQGRAAEAHYRRAQTLAAETRLDQALGALDDALRYAPQEPSYLALRQQILAAMEQAEQLRRQGLAQADLAQWDQALETIQQALAAYSTLPSGAQDLQRIKQRAHDHYLRLAQQQLDMENWPDAQQHANQALIYLPQSRDAQDISTQISQRRQAIEMIRQAQDELAGGGDAQGILDRLNQARRLYPNHPEIDGLILQAKRRLLEQNLQQAEQARQLQQYQQALRILQDAGRTLPGDLQIAQRLEAVRQELAGWHLAHARQRLAARQPGNALLDLLLAREYAPYDSAAAADFGRAKLALAEQISYSIGFLGFRSSWQNRQIASRLEDPVRQYLHRIQHIPVRLTDRAALGPLLGDIGLDDSELNATEFRLKPGRLSQVDGLLIGQVVQLRLATDKKAEKGHVSHPAGTKMEPNPEYRSAQERVNAARGQLTRARDKLKAAQKAMASFPVPPPPNESPARKRLRREARQRLDQAEKDAADALRDLNRSEKQLADTPRRISVPIVVEWHYPISRVTRTATIVCYLKLIDTASGDIRLAEEITGQASGSDLTVPGDPIHHVPADPLTLPSDDYLIDQAALACLDQIYVLLGRTLRDNGRRFAALHRQARDQGDPDAAVEYALLYLLARPVVTAQAALLVDYLHQAAQQRNQGVAIDLRQSLGEHLSLLRPAGMLPADLRQTEAGIHVHALQNCPIPPGLHLPCRLHAVDGMPAERLADLEDILSDRPAGQRVTLQLAGPDRSYDLEVQLVPGRH
ncbi:MAG: tetratricopeptide repeat protein [Sedimentisphaerales bacterium]|nr:tetratricopeptide repeat protein [Sedimentisphaerales bacterium]